MYFKETLEKMKQNNEPENISVVLLDQKAKYDKLSKMQIENNLFNYNKLGIITLPQDAIFHGTSFDYEKLLNIKKEGILASEFALNIPERYMETYYMADFFKNITNKPMSITKCLKCANSNEAFTYLPKIALNDDSKVMFIINTDNEKVKKYLNRDLFGENNDELLSFIDEEFYYSLQSRKSFHYFKNMLGQSSIPIGVPYNAISGIVIDKSIQKDKEKYGFIKKLFGKELFIISNLGKVLSTPEKINTENKEEEL